MPRLEGLAWFFETTICIPCVDFVFTLCDGLRLAFCCLLVECPSLANNTVMKSSGHYFFVHLCWHFCWTKCLKTYVTFFQILHCPPPIHRVLHEACSPPGSPAVSPLLPLPVTHCGLCFPLIPILTALTLLDLCWSLLVLSRLSSPFLAPLCSLQKEWPWWSWTRTPPPAWWQPRSRKRKPKRRRNQEAMQRWLQKTLGLERNREIFSNVRHGWGVRKVFGKGRKK